MNKTKYTRISDPGQQGVALAMALVVLVILTILGVSAMKSSSLEVKMASGIQDNTLAFQAAESGLVDAFRNVVLDPNQTTTTTYKPTGSPISAAVSATTDTTFTGYSVVQSSSQPSSKVGYQYANFRQTATGETTSGAKVVIHQGVRQLVNK